MLKNPLKTLSIFLFLVLLHSFVAGVLLIFLPMDIMNVFGFNEFQENFFRAQGGVFHIVLCVAYFYGAINPVKHNLLIKFAIIAKLMAFIFLSIYFLLINQVLLILLSGIADLIMGILIFVLNKNMLKKSESYVQA